MAASGVVDITLAARDAQLRAAFDRAQADVRKLTDELEKLKNKSGDAAGSVEGMGSSMAGTFGKAAAGLVGFGSALAGVATIAGTIKREYEDFLQQRQAAGEFQAGIADPLMQAIENMTQTDALSAREVTANFQAIASETGASLDTVIRAGTSALAAKGDIQTQTALEQLQAVIATNPRRNIQDMTAITGASLDIRKLFGGTPEQAIGLMMSMLQTARPETMGATARNVVPAVGQLKGFGMGPQEAAAMMAAVTQRSLDPEGMRSASAVIQFAKQIKEATGGVKELIGKGLTEQMEYLMTPAGEKARNKLVGAFSIEYQKAGGTEGGDLTGEAKQYVAMRELLVEGSDTRRLMADALSKIPSYTDADKLYFQDIERKRSVGLLEAGRLESVYRGGQERLLSDFEMGQQGINREGLERALQQSGETTWAKRKMLMWGFDFGTAFGGESANQRAASILMGEAVPGGQLSPETAGQKILYDMAQTLLRLEQQQQQMIDRPQDVRIVDDAIEAAAKRSIRPGNPAQQLNKP